MSAATRDRMATWREDNPLRAARKRKGLSMADTAAAIGVGMSAVQGWEQGSQRPTRDENLAALAKFIGARSADAVTRRFDEWLAACPT